MNLIEHRRAQCVNCGKIINPKTLICDACGTDYNEKPKCEHVYGEWFFEHNIQDYTYNLLLKCEKCGEVITLKCSNSMVNDIRRCAYGSW